MDWSEWVKGEDRRFSWEFAVMRWRRSGGLGGKQGPERDFIYFTELANIIVIGDPKSAV